MMDDEDEILAAELGKLGAKGGSAGAGRPEAGPAGHDASPQDPDQTDAGAGFGGLVLPAGAYVVKGGQVRWVPAVDMTIVVLASLSLVRVLARTWTRSRRRHGRP